MRLLINATTDEIVVNAQEVGQVQSALQSLTQDFDIEYTDISVGLDEDGHFNIDFAVEI